MSHISAREFLSRLQKCYEKYRTNYPTEMKTEGYLSYLNGNDSTPFDYNYNDHLCEFGDFYTENQQKGLYYIKMIVHSTGSVKVFVYRGSEEQIMHHPEKFTEVIYSEEDIAYMAEYLTKNADGKRIFDRPVAEINWGT